MSSYNYLFKYIIIGDTGTGKSCILRRFIDNNFNDIHDITIGVEFGVNNIIAKNGKKIKIQIWDTAGQEMFRSITRSYYRDATVTLIVFDITHYDTFKNIHKWFKEMSEMGNDKSVIILVGNKSDLSHRREVNIEDAKNLADKHGCLYIETSAKNGTNVENIFRVTMEKVLENIENRLVSWDKIGIKLYDVNNTSSLNKSTYKKKCCYLS